MRRRVLLLATTAVLWCAQGPTKLKPGFNLFSREQDIRLGKEAAAEIAKQVHVIHHRELDGYLDGLGGRLASQPQAGGFPYSFSLVHDKAVNAFALPGGPTFVHTALVLSADNEYELAGVIAHEIAHVALRHGTNQASKANLIALPALLAAAAVGDDSLLGQLTQIGIGVGANSVLLRYSRNAERDADLLGAQIMAGAGYDPVAMARFFQKLEGEGKRGGWQFFSDHPNPGNRVKAVEREIGNLPRRAYDADTRQFPHMKNLVRQLGDPPPPKPARK